MGVSEQWVETGIGLGKGGQKQNKKKETRNKDR